MAENAKGVAQTNGGQEATSFIGRFMVLRGAIRELWIVFAIKLLAIMAYALMNSTLALWLSSDLGLSDQSAGYMVAAWSVSMTVITVLVGSLTDAIGLRKTFLLGVMVCIAARSVMTFSTATWLALGVGLFPLAIGEALGTPVMVAAIHRYSTTAQRSISFSMFYVIMNVGFAVSGFIFDGVRKGMGEHGSVNLPLVGCSLTTYQILFLVSLLLELMLLPILYFGVREAADADNGGVASFADKPKVPHRNAFEAIRLAIRDALRGTVRNLLALGRQPGFYQLLAFLMLIAFVKLIYKQMDYAYPKFGIRELGEGAPIGRLWAINAILIIPLVPIVGALSQKSSAYRMVTLGSAISAASVLIMALPPSWFQGLADGVLGHWLGHGYLGLTGSVSPWYVMTFFFVVLLSLGEALYSPRVYEYAAAIAPKGQEASYGALSYVPFFLAKLFVGTFSGILLANYCPQEGPRHSGTMWLIVALTTTICPLGLIVLRRYIRVQEAGREG